MLWTLWALACITTADIDARLDADDDGFDRDVDCDDTDANVHPEATELCNGLDDDCDGQVDPAESEDAVDGWDDSDGDGFGAGTTRRACEGTVAWTSTPGDCNDNESSVHPGASEVCDGLDNDCDPTTRCRLLGEHDDEALGWIHHSLAAPFRGSPAIADTDGDGVLDLVGLGQDLILRRLAGPLAAPSTSSSVSSLNAPAAGSFQVHAADLDADGRAEVLVETWSGAEWLDVYWGHDGGAIDTASHTRIGLPPQPQAAPSRVAALAGSEGAAIFVTIQDSDSTRMHRLSLSPGHATASLDDAQPHHTLAVGDARPAAACEQPGGSDCELLLIHDTGSEGTFAYRLLGAPEPSEDAWPLAPHWRGWNHVPAPMLADASGDLDGDGEPDWVLAAPATAEVPDDTVYLLFGDAPAEGHYLPNAPRWRREASSDRVLALGLPDLDHDGISDLAVLDYSGGRYSVRVAYGPLESGGSFSDFDLELNLPEAPLGRGFLSTADVNGDSYRDLVVVTPTVDRTVSVWTGVYE